jgi:hypothetical protein
MRPTTASEPLDYQGQGYNGFGDVKKLTLLTLLPYEINATS